MRGRQHDGRPSRSTSFARPLEVAKKLRWGIRNSEVDTKKAGLDARGINWSRRVLAQRPALVGCNGTRRVLLNFVRWTINTPSCKPTSPQSSLSVSRSRDESDPPTTADAIREDLANSLPLSSRRSTVSPTQHESSDQQSQPMIGQTRVMKKGAQDGFEFGGRWS